MLVAGSAAECDALATQLADVEGVSAVLTAKDEAYSKGLPEHMSPLVVACQEAGSYSHILAGSNAFGKNLVPRVGALLDVQPIADIAEIKSEDTHRYNGSCDWFSFGVVLYAPRLASPRPLVMNDCARNAE